MATLSLPPVLMVGGSGTVGAIAARMLRRLQPDLPITIAGRDEAKARRVAESVGHADAARVDLERVDLGLPAERPFSAVVMFFKDDTLSSMRFAQARGAPYVSISSGSFEIAPEVARYVQRPSSAPILMASHWLAGAASLPALYFARDFERVERIDIGAVLDEQDVGGPAAYVDFERLTGAAPNAMLLENGRWQWATGALAKRRFRTVDGTEVEGQAYAPLDGLSLAAATGASDIRFDLVVGETATRRRGKAFSTEIVVEMHGRLKNGTRGMTRHEIVHPEGQAPLTALGVAVAVERLLGLAGGEPVRPGLYLPDVLIDPGAMVRRLEEIGTVVRRA